MKIFCKNNSGTQREKPRRFKNYNFWFIQYPLFWWTVSRFLVDFVIFSLKKLLILKDWWWCKKHGIIYPTLKLLQNENTFNQFGFLHLVIFLLNFLMFFYKFFHVFGDISRDFGNISRYFGNIWRYFGNIWRDFGNIWRDFGNISRDFGNIWRDFVKLCHVFSKFPHVFDNLWPGFWSILSRFLLNFVVFLIVFLKVETRRYLLNIVCKLETFQMSDLTVFTQVKIYS